MIDDSIADESWRPVASPARLRHRALLLSVAREFFKDRGVLEVETPSVINAPVSDVNLHSAEVRLSAGALQPKFLHTSPEYAMKRLLASGIGDIYQICHVFRCDEQSPLHNAEFTLIEWYRVAYTLETLMSEVAELVAALLAPPFESALPSPLGSAEHVSYQDAFQRAMGIDPLTAPISDLAAAARATGFSISSTDPVIGSVEERDVLLDFLMAVKVGPELGKGRLCFVHDYPASQAALAELDPFDPRVALRFELYLEGIELANGFRELVVERTQRRRFIADQELRRKRGLPQYSLDERLLGALRAGIPAASGVAVGFDRVLMRATGAAHINQVLTFPLELA